MADEHLDDLLGAYALDAVDEHERRQVEAYLEADPRARDEVERHREVAAMLAFSGERPPEGLWDRIAGDPRRAAAGARPAARPGHADRAPPTLAGRARRRRRRCRGGRRRRRRHRRRARRRTGPRVGRPARRGLRRGLDRPGRPAHRAGRRRPAVQRRRRRAADGHPATCPPPRCPSSPTPRRGSCGASTATTTSSRSACSATAPASSLHAERRPRRPRHHARAGRRGRLVDDRSGPRRRARLSGIRMPERLRREGNGTPTSRPPPERSPMKRTFIAAARRCRRGPRSPCPPRRPAQSAATVVPDARHPRRHRRRRRRRRGRRPRLRARHDAGHLRRSPARR